MHLDPRKLILVCILSCIARAVPAQSIAFQPGAPTSAQAVNAILTEPFNCTAPQPVVSARSANSLTLDSIFPNGIVNCPAIPFPMPTLSRFGVDLGFFAPGKYLVTWNFYLNQSPAPPQLLGSTSASLVIAPGAGGATAPADPTPLLSTWAMFALCSLFAVVGVRKSRG